MLVGPVSWHLPKLHRYLLTNLCKVLLLQRGHGSNGSNNLGSFSAMGCTMQEQLLFLLYLILILGHFSTRAFAKTQTTNTARRIHHSTGSKIGIEAQCTQEGWDEFNHGIISGFCPFYTYTYSAFLLGLSSRCWWVPISFHRILPDTGEGTISTTCGPRVNGVSVTECTTQYHV